MLLYFYDQFSTYDIRNYSSIMQEIVIDSTSNSKPWSPEYVGSRGLVDLVLMRLR